ncbi:MAG: hypothetical protein LBQ19_01500 [Synergistaceae bacterium]|jgi:hypothetical protein|nr:hypothetical protein [Synergistaceae bacterium]
MERYRNIDRYLGARVYEKISGKGFVERLAATDTTLSEITGKLIAMRGIALESIHLPQDGDADSKRLELQARIDSLKKEITDIASSFSEFMENWPESSDEEQSALALEKIDEASVGFEEEPKDPLDREKLDLWLKSLTKNNPQ